MADGFVKFPRTPHLFWLGAGTPRGDKVLGVQDAQELLQRPVIVEEKVDGACIGISIDQTGRLRVQSRGAYLAPGAHPQFAPLWPWVATRDHALRDALGSTLILFGEWCYARHSVEYDALPDWFLAFDVYDRVEARFWSRTRREALTGWLGLATVPLLATGCFDRSSLERLLGPSRVGSQPMEGIYLRWDDGPCLAARAKLVRPGWVQHDEAHWSSRPMSPNRRLTDPGASVARAGR